jgi:hypothetical protein
MKYLVSLFAAFSLFATAQTVRGQATPGNPFGLGGGADSVERFQRQLDQIEMQTAVKTDTSIPVTDRALFDYGGYLSVNYFSFDDPQHNNHGLREYDLVGYARVNIDGVHEFFARGRVTYQDYNRGDSFDDGDYQEHYLLELGYYRFDLQRALAAYSGIQTKNDLVFEGGRQFVYWANGLALGQTLDGVTIDTVLGPFQGQFVAGVTPVRTVDFDFSRPGFDHHTLRGFYGAMFSAKIQTPGVTHRPFVYALVQDDYNHGDTLVNGPPTSPITTRFHYDSYYLGAGSKGSIGDHLLYGVELVHEGGRGLSNSFSESTGGQVTQTQDTINAYAGDLRLDYLLNDPSRTRLGAEVIYGSGDGNRLQTNNTFGGPKPNTVDMAFNAFGALDTGVAFNPDVSNLVALRAGASTFPWAGTSAMRNLQVGADLFGYFKAELNAPIDEPASRGIFLGVEPDLYVNWQIRSDVTLALRYGVFFPNAEVFSNLSARQFFQTSLTFAF